jgi:macrolide transport system ATP-binding/permease protein
MARLSRLRALFGKERLAREHQDELQFHLSMREQLNRELGMAPDAARRDARRRFGNPSLWRERMREIDLTMLPGTVLQDLRYGARMLWRNLGFTLAAVLALGIGIGANTATFTAYKAFFKRSLDARDAGQMVNLALMLHSGSSEQSSDPVAWFSIPDYETYRDHVHSFSGLIAASIPQNLTLTGAGGIAGRRNAANGSLVGRLGLLPSVNTMETASTFLVSENYFSVLGVGAVRGRTFASEDSSKMASSPAGLISENYWQKRFGGDAAVLGKTVRLNGVAVTIVGITPHNFVGTNVEAPDFWLPLSLEPLIHPDNNWLRSRENLCCRLYARLAPGVNIDQAQAEMTLVAGQLSALHDPHADLGKPAKAVIWPGSPFPYPLKQYGGLEYAILLIMVAVGMVLVIACANVASLQLARAASRQNELGMRQSLGASRFRIIRQLLTESALLGLIAGAVALLFSWAFLQTVVVLIADAFPEEYGTFIFHVTPDPGIFAYVFCISLAAGILFGLAPALESSGAALSSASKASPGTGKVRNRRMRDLLTVAQVAVSLVLLIAGSMLIRSSIRAVKMDTGYDTKHVLDLEVRFPEGEKYGADRRATLIRELRTRLSALPGVVAITSARAPDGGGIRTAAVSVNGEKPSPKNTRAILFYTYIQSNYFQTLGIPLLFGRGFQAQAGQRENAVILSESAAHLLWPGQNPIGRSLHLEPGGQFKVKGDVLSDGPAYEVIGVSRDTRGILLNGTDSEQIYLPMPKDRIQDFAILIRTQSAPTQITNAIGPMILSLDSSLVAYTFTLEQMLRQTESFLASSISAAFASAVGMLGLLLASMGIYGTVSYIVVLRTREVGIRIALGAKKRDVLILMLRESTRPVVVGLVVGVCLALGASYLLRGVLYGLNTIDGISFVGVSILFLAIALLAAYLPSRRATQVDPMVALRYE